MPCATPALIGSCRLARVGEKAMPSGFSAIAWFMPASHEVGLPLPSMIVTSQPSFSPASLM